MRMTVLAMGAENLSLEAISALLKQQGHQVSLVFDPSLFDDVNYFRVPFLHRIFDGHQGLIKKIIDSKPDLIGVSVFTDNLAWALSFSRGIKKVLDVPIVYGGIYYGSSGICTFPRLC